MRPRALPFYSQEIKEDLAIAILAGGGVLMNKPNKNEVVKSDGRGVPSAKWLDQDREITRSIWLQEAFPEWGTFLNQQINATVVEPKTVVLWWFGGASFGLKTPKSFFLIDNYAGPSDYTTYDHCGVCRTSGAPSLEWLRLHPQVVDPWAFEQIDAVLCTHHHQDHCDIYSIKAALQTTKALFIGPEVTCRKFRAFGVPEERIRQVKPGDTIKFQDVELAIVPNYDRMACLTGEEVQDGKLDYGKYAVSFLFKTDAGGIIHLGDTLYHNGYRAIGENHQVDLCLTNMGHNAPGVTDKLNPYEVYRIAEALKAEVVIPYHYDNWASSALDPQQLEMVVKANRSKLKVVILKHGAKFVFPKDNDIGHYQYPDLRERFSPEKSWEYGKKS